MTVYVGPAKITAELPGKRALIDGKFSDYPIDKEVFVEDSGDTVWRAKVETRTTAGIVVRILGIAE